MLEERGHEVAEEGLSVRGGAVEVPVFERSAGHGGLNGEERTRVRRGEEDVSRA